MEVKGTIIMDYVRLIRSNKGLNWDKWLEPEDWEVINSEVLASKWYPYALFRRLGWASYQEVAGGDPERVKSFGRFNMQNMLQLYHNLRVPGDPVASVNKMARIWRNFFQGEGTESRITGSGDNWVTYQMKAPDKEAEPEKIVAFAYQLCGQLLELVSAANGRNPKEKVVSEGHSQYITIEWEPPEK